jgi:Flp pilus assembly pilin Flp
MLIARGWGALLSEDDGQDLLEYALLAALVAIVSYAALLALQLGLHDSYLNWGSRTNSIADAPAPGAGS